MWNYFNFDFKCYCLIMLIEHLKVMQLKIWITNCWVHLTNKCQIGIKVMQLHGIKEREHIRCKPTSPYKLWKLQSGSSDQHLRGRVQRGGRRDLQKCDCPIIQGRIQIVKLSNPSYPLDVDPMIQIDVSIVCTKILICTWYIHILFISYLVQLWRVPVITIHS